MPWIFASRVRPHPSLFVVLFLLGQPGAVCADESSHDSAYWLWAGRSVLQGDREANTLYIHQGTLERSSSRIPFPRYVSQGAAPVRTQAKGLYLVFRVEVLQDAQQIVERAEKIGRQWAERGNVVLGIQIDYDSPTNRLPEYVTYLRQIRRALSKEYRLSVTGLADWAVNSPSAILGELSEVADEIIFQLYNGWKPLPKFEEYLWRLPKVHFPFRIGLLEGQMLPREIQNDLNQNPYYRGEVYFVLPDKKKL